MQGAALQTSGLSGNFRQQLSSGGMSGALMPPGGGVGGASAGGLGLDDTVRSVLANLNQHIYYKF
jgi:hypothetical protein